MKPQQRQGGDDAEVQHAGAWEDRGRVERHVQVGGGEAVAGVLKLTCFDPFSDGQRDVRPMAAVRPASQTRQPCDLKPSPQAFDGRFGSGVEQQLNRVSHGSRLHVRGS
jgi:hypothetical protein